MCGGGACWEAVLALLAPHLSSLRLMHCVEQPLVALAALLCHRLRSLALDTTCDATHVDHLSALTALTQLKVVHRGKAKTRELLPAALCALTGLRELLFWAVWVKGLPAGFGALTSLTKLELYHGAQDFVQGWDELTGLQRLVLGVGMDEAGAAAAPLTGLTSLRELLTSQPWEYRMVPTCLPDALCDLPALEMLSLDCCSGSSAAILPDSLSCLTGVTALRLTHAAAEHVSFAVHALPGLVQLWLWDCSRSLPARLPENVVQLEQLRLLSVKGRPGAKDPLQVEQTFSLLTGLRVLDLRNVELHGSLAVLAGLTGLQALCLAGATAGSAPTLHGLVQLMHSLRDQGRAGVLCFDHNRMQQHELRFDLAEGCDRLQRM